METIRIRQATKLYYLEGEKMQCEVEGCLREANTRKFGNLCLMHYKRFAKHGDFENHMRAISENARQRENSKCKYCDRQVGKIGAFGMCNKHYQMFRLHGDALYFDERQRPTSHGYYRTGKKGTHEHRKVYEDYYGIKLNPSQCIHHINFIKTDNRIENLYCYDTQGEHTRVHNHYRKLRKDFPDAVIEFKNGMYQLADIGQMIPGKENRYKEIAQTPRLENGARG